MLKIGLTGGIGSGKSTISNFLKEIGIKVVDADKISREVLGIYPEINERIRNEFGENVFVQDGNLNRKMLGNIIFQNTEKKKSFENIIIPYIIKEIRERIDALEKNREKIIVLDAPTLMEQKLNEEMDYNITVWVDRETQIERVMGRDKSSIEEVISRIDSQMSLDKKKELSDFIIDNRGAVQDTLQQVKKVLRVIEEMGKEESEKR
ncbi:dephospho-CoA kinase [Oceanirhabdus seepicola]|uniref:Dephospho-CoA kinase n=1 Tax=Oceanirhabdus seepicola TaxID=2828781 RepID=A0A9J6P267_9CLOT|nr:dephospho-CoA kinase [Oceanirhabdus seepicola]MCM1990703.1 dephospho-CoA kinase [Oceanirhabdus seepicola]